MTDTWADCYIGPIYVPPRLLGWILKGLADVYGIVRMPAHDLPNHKQQRSRSAQALRQLLRYLENGQCIAFHPEAGGFQELLKPPAGSGSLLTPIDRKRIPMIPIGVFEENDRLVVNIGKPFTQGEFQRKSDADAADTCMNRIAQLVPSENRRAYRENTFGDGTTSHVAR